MLIKGVIITILASAIGAFAALFLKQGATGDRIKIIFGATGYVFGSLIGIYALQFGEVSILYPITSSTYVFSFLLARGVLKEKITRNKIMGLGLIILGIIILSLG